MGQTNQSNNFIIYNIPLRYDIQFEFNELGIQEITQIIQNINQTTFYFVEEGPGHGSEDIKKECNVKGFDFFFLFCLFDGRHEWENHIQLKRTALKYKKKKHVHIGKELEAH